MGSRGAWGPGKGRFCGLLEVPKGAARARAASGARHRWPCAPTTVRVIHVSDRPRPRAPARRAGRGGAVRRAAAPVAGGGCATPPRPGRTFRPDLSLSLLTSNHGGAHDERGAWGGAFARQPHRPPAADARAIVARRRSRGGLGRRGGAPPRSRYVSVRSPSVRCALRGRDRDTSGRPLTNPLRFSRPLPRPRRPPTPPRTPRYPARRPIPGRCRATCCCSSASVLLTPRVA